MGFFDKIKDIMSASDEDEDYEETVTETSREVPSGNDYYSSSSGRSYEKEKTTQFPSDRKAKASVGRINSQLQVALVKPERFEDAIACGSTMVRLGTAIFGARNYNQSPKG